MKKLLAITLAAVLLLSLVACGGGGGGAAAFAKTITLKYAEDDSAPQYQVKLGYPDDAALSGSDMDSSCTISNEAKDYEIYVSLSADTGYNDNKATDKTEREQFKEGKFAGFDGYSYKESDYSYYVIVNLGATEYENEALQLAFSIGSAKRDQTKTAEQIFNEGDVQKILNSFEFLGKNPQAK